MCKSCSEGINRRQFVASGTAAFGAVSLAGTMISAAEEKTLIPSREKKPAIVKVVFLYTRAEDCDAGTAEAMWPDPKYRWHPYPGYQYRHHEQRAKFTKKISAMAKRIGIQADFHPGHLYTSAQAREYAAKTKAQAPDAVLAVCLSNACQKWSYDIIKTVGAPGIIYLPTGASHQVPAQYLTDTPGLHFSAVPRCTFRPLFTKTITVKKLLNSLTGFQPHLTWLLANFPDMVGDIDDKARVEEILEDLNLKYAKHSGLVLELCSQSEGLVEDEPEAFCGDGKQCGGCDLSETFCNHKL